MYHDESALGVLSFSLVCFFRSSASVSWGVQGVSIVCDMCFVAIGGCLESVVFVVEWICLVVMTRDLVLVKGSQGGAGSLPPDAVS